MISCFAIRHGKCSKLNYKCAIDAQKAMNVLLVSFGGVNASNCIAFQVTKLRTYFRIHLIALNESIEIDGNSNFFRFSYIIIMRP